MGPRAETPYLSASGSFQVVTTGFGAGLPPAAVPGGSGISAPSCSAPSVSAEDGGVDAGDATSPKDCLVLAGDEAGSFVGREVGTSVASLTCA